MPKPTDPRQFGFGMDFFTSKLDSEWTPPTELPDRLGGMIGIDTETKDDGLNESKGSGWPWHGGHLVGVSISADNFRGYLPIRHAGGGNMDEGMVLRWLRHVLSDPKQEKVFANAMYDIGWLLTDNVPVAGMEDGAIRDVLWAEALLDELREDKWIQDPGENKKTRLGAYSLDGIAYDRLGRRKDETMLREVARAAGIDPKADLWKLPAKFVGAYAEMDAELPREIWGVQKPLIEAEELTGICALEHDLLPMYIDMRKRGIRVNEGRVDIMVTELESAISDKVKELSRQVGFEVNVWETDSLAKAFRAENLYVGKTAKTGKDSITQQVMEVEQNKSHWLPQGVLEVRKLDKLRGTFLEGVIKSNLHRGRVHGEIHPLRSDEGGTISGRLSMSNPNLQFIPARTEMGQCIRMCFEAELGEDWLSADFSQQEPRLLVHFASLVRKNGRSLPGAIEARDRYRDDPDMSYHQFAAEITGLDYKPAKILNLAIIYGRGVNTTADEMGKDADEVRAMFKKHEEEMPFAKACAGVAEARVKKNRFIRTLLRRKCRFYRGDPSNPIVEHVKRWDPRWKNSMMPLEEFRSKYPGERWSIARLNKSLNTLIQPSAADQTKKAMRDLWYGERDLARRILVQIHDELCASVPHGEDGWRIADRVCEVMKAAVPLEVPSKVDPDIMATHWLGPSLNRDGTLKDDSRSLSEALFKEHYKTANRHHNGRRA